MEKGKELAKTNVTATDEKKSVEKREEYIDNFTAKLKEWNRELERFEINNERKLTQLRQKMDKSISQLKAERDKLNNKLDRVEIVGRENFKNLQKDLDTLWEDLKEGFSAVKKELKRHD
ncbi:hypothetical protein [Fodinibius halophilus]|uniref:Coiled coil domain-containing protein n=1 Tax=Fodinibius halophilus TaxID=1736908 RepID=A0A6M1T347_9BACT|nr:hypothetical protein [Fodinibius halophilus]NGP89856.1 hypothetical protein [Fodinibius halophilus]